MKYIQTFESFIVERKFTTAERKEMVKNGQALPDGSFPIENVEDLKNAIQAFGRSNEKKHSEVAKHIAARAKSLNKEELIPQSEIFQKALKA